jgi:hypothetical protein
VLGSVFHRWFRLRHHRVVGFRGWITWFTALTDNLLVIGLGQFSAWFGSVGSLCRGFDRSGHNFDLSLGGAHSCGAAEIHSRINAG